MSGIPGPPDQQAAVWDPVTQQLEGIVLASVHMWTLCHPKTVAVPMILRHFVASDVYGSLCVLAESVGLPDKPTAHRDTAERAAVELWAGQLYDLIITLAASVKLPKIVVSSRSLPSVPLASLTTSDEINISARLESLESGLKKLAESVNRAGLNGARPKQPEMIVTVTPPWNKRTMDLVVI